MPLTLRDHARAAGLDVLVGADQLDRTVVSVQLLDPLSTERGDPGALVLLVWAPARRGSPLPPLAPLLARLVAATPAGIVVLPRGRAVRPPAEALRVARDAGVPLLWVDAGVGEGNAPAEVLDTLRRVASTPAGRDAELPGALARVLDGDLDVHRVAERAAAELRARVVVTGVAGREVAAASADRPIDPSGAPDDPGAGAPGEAGLHPVLDAASVPDAVLVPLVSGERQLGSWAVQRREPLSTVELQLVDALTPVLVLAMRVHATEELAAAPVQALLTAVLGDDLAARESAVRRSKRLAVFPARPVVFLVVVPFGADVGRAGLARLAQQLEPPVRAADDRATTLVHEGSVVALVGADIDLDRLQRAMYRRVRVPLSLGASRAVDDVRSYPGAHRQAQRAATIGRQLGTVNRVNRFESLGVTRLLYQLPEHERRAFTRDVLGPASGSDDAAVEARRVLRSFRSTNGNSAESARQLFLHHNTFRQRLTKLQATVGDFVGDADVRLAVFVALDLHRLDNDREA